MIDKNNIPKHIAIIMDGNGRWAKRRGLPRSFGHRAGIERIREIIKAAGNLGVEVITFFAFSAENWQRPKKEIAMLMRSLDKFLSREIERLDKDNIRFMAIGGGDPVPEYLQEKIKEAEKKTGRNSGLTVVLALNYGARQEITEAAKKIIRLALQGKINAEDLTPDDFARYLYTDGLPEPDLLIRTSGEMRISNFLLWQISYAELYFPQKYWPDFTGQDLEEAIRVYQERERRFGRIEGDVAKKDN